MYMRPQSNKYFGIVFTWWMYIISYHISCVGARTDDDDSNVIRIYEKINEIRIYIDVSVQKMVINITLKQLFFFVFVFESIINYQNVNNKS